MSRSDVSGAHYALHIMLQYRSRVRAVVVSSTPAQSLNRYDFLNDVPTRHLCEFNAVTRQREYVEAQGTSARNARSADRACTLGRNPCRCARRDGVISASDATPPSGIWHWAMSGMVRTVQGGRAPARPGDERVTTESNAPGARHVMRQKSTEGAGSRAPSVPGTDSRRSACAPDPTRRGIRTEAGVVLGPRSSVVAGARASRRVPAARRKLCSPISGRQAPPLTRDTAPACDG